MLSQLRRTDMTDTGAQLRDDLIQRFPFYGEDGEEGRSVKG